MKVDIEDVSSCKKTLKIEIPPEDVNSEYKKAYDEIRKNVTVPGFRKGRTPEGVLRKRFKEHVRGEIIEKLVPPAFEKAVEDAELEILRPLEAKDIKPPLDEMSVDEDDSLSFEVSVDVKPEIELPDFPQLEVDKSEVNVTQEAVDEHLERLRENKAEYIPIEERPIQDGDYAKVDLIAKSGDEVLNEAEEEILRVGGDSPIPELSEHVIGMNPGEEKDFTVTFPEDHKVQIFAGKEISFHIEIHSVNAKQLPDLDDDFAKDLGSDDLQHLKAKAWNDLIDFHKFQQRDKQKQELIDQLIEKSEFEVPDFLIANNVEAMVRNMKYERNDEDFEASEEELAELHTMSLSMIRRMWILEEISKREDITASDEEVEAEVKRIAESQGRDPQKYMKLLEAVNRLDGIKTSIQEDKVFDLLIEQASPKRTLIV